MGGKSRVRLAAVKIRRHFALGRLTVERFQGGVWFSNVDNGHAWLSNELLFAAEEYAWSGTGRETLFNVSGYGLSVANGKSTLRLGGTYGDRHDLPTPGVMLTALQDMGISGPIPRAFGHDAAVYFEYRHKMPRRMYAGGDGQTFVDGHPGEPDRWEHAADMTVWRGQAHTTFLLRCFRPSESPNYFWLSMPNVVIDEASKHDDGANVTVEIDDYKVTMWLNRVVIQHGYTDFYKPWKQKMEFSTNAHALAAWLRTLALTTSCEGCGEPIDRGSSRDHRSCPIQ